MRITKDFPQEYLYRGQINYLKIARETDWITTNKLEEFTQKNKRPTRTKAAKEETGKVSKKGERATGRSRSKSPTERTTLRENRGARLAQPDRRQHFIETYGNIKTALNLLDPKERKVITYLNGLDGNQPLSQKEVGEKMYFTSSWVSQVNRNALKKLDRLKQIKTVGEA